MGLSRSFAAFAALAAGVDASSVLGNAPYFSNSSSSAIHLHNSTSGGIDYGAALTATTTVYKTVHVVDPTGEPASEYQYASASFASASPGEGYNRFGFKGEQTATFATSGPIATLSPNVHWSWDTKSVKNVVPVPVGKGSQMYYGVGDPSEAGQFAFLTYHFTAPSVNLDHCDYIKSTEHTSDGLAVTFADKKSFDHAAESWKHDDGLVLIAFAKGCGDYNKGDRCYFKVADLKIDSSSFKIIATGASTHPDELISFAETEWGHWSPTDSNGKTKSSKPGPSFGWNSGNSTSPNNNGSTAAGFTELSRCSSANKTGLPNACLGGDFDRELDHVAGYMNVSAESKQFIDEITGMSNHGGHYQRGIVRRSLWSWLKKNIIKPIVQAYNWVAEQVSIGGSFSKDFSWKFPDPLSDNPQVNALLDPLIHPAQSPWGDAILLRTFAVDKPKEHSTFSGRLDIYCVGCGVSGAAKIAGRARWSPLAGFQEGQVELDANMHMVLKIGIDAHLSYKAQFNSELFSIGLPGLSYGVVTIGPQIAVSSNVALEARADGQLLAGAIVDLPESTIVMDFVNPWNSKNTGWNPTVQPVFEANGEISLSASLGLPISLRCGITVASFERSVGLIDEPSIKAIAQVAASVGYSNSTKQIAGGFLDTNGCKGISTRLVWRNKLYVDVLKLTTVSISDTDDQTIAQACIALGKNHRRGRQAPRLPMSPSRVHSRSTDTGSDVVKVIDSARDKSASLSYDIHAVPSQPYRDSEGYEFAPLVDLSASAMAVSCTDGNIYAANVKMENSTSCSSLWGGTEDSTVVFDGSRRLIHYYNDTMAATGVSRLRVHPSESMPMNGVVVALGLYEGDLGSYYVAVDHLDRIFYPVVCDFADKAPSKIFLAKDPDAGVVALEREDLAHSVTGGRVTKCYPLPLTRQV